ncbi:MAG: bifunctional 2-polyprenyl-6-hydroxyphenol methylase/3-demethylubiquinol 3-O-methyltransferase UbiG [Planctomycetes bacterium]|nr:bifunctional 2-polyprenyl-6-hydroxyphenol methylase/3-demethylubiquinol 3-O-methyltransferase UbiG [Planctomycetota bacterium]
MTRTRANDLEIYERAASAWWDPRASEFRSLRAIQAARAKRLVREWGERLRGARIADLGCGGGHLSDPLRAHGAYVIGVDRSAASLGAARSHVLREHVRSRACFVRGDVTATPLTTAACDFVLLGDVVEHVERPDEVLAEAARLLRPGGELFVSTLNATRRARWLAVGLAERVGLVPRGTHDPRLFVAPARLIAWAAQHGLERLEVWGESVKLVRTVLRWTIELEPGDDTSVSYCVRFVRGGRA